ncbi:MAG: hypothetical protein ABL963_07965 [Longimicrobiales bacterium]
MALTRARRQQLILSWIGIALGWIASMGVGFLLLTQWLVLLVPASTVGALGVGAVITKRIRTPHLRASIKVGDLHPTRRARAKRS